MGNRRVSASFSRTRDELNDFRIQKAACLTLLGISFRLCFLRFPMHSVYPLRRPRLLLPENRVSGKDVMGIDNENAAFADSNNESNGFIFPSIDSRCMYRVGQDILTLLRGL